MARRPPPGRSGRLWLVHRLAVAGRGADLLEQKRRALQLERDRLAARTAEMETRWRAAALEAERWLAQAVIIGGVRQLRLVASHTRPAEVSVRWQTWMGCVHPDRAILTLSPPPDVAALGSTGGLAAAAAAIQQVLEVGVELARVSRALEIVGSELALTGRRERVIERRWSPQLKRMLADVDLRLDEMEREDGVRARRVRSLVRKEEVG